MYTIDLLKGQGLPLKSRPRRTALATLILVTPLLAGGFLFTHYLQNRVLLASRQHDLRETESRLASLSNTLKTQKALVDQISRLDAYLTEVAGALPRHTQWSGLLRTVVESMPADVILCRLEARPATVNREKPLPGDAKKTMTVACPTRTLRICVNGPPQTATDEAVLEFINRLRASPLFVAKTEVIQIVAHQLEEVGGRKLVRYDIDCVFKPQT
jgi:hypothetical protein